MTSSQNRQRQIQNRNPSLVAVTEELRAAGVTFTIITGSRCHPKVRWLNAAGIARTVTTSGTSRNWHAPMNSRSVVRRILRQDGAL
jgi:hypothetical protein